MDKMKTLILSVLSVGSMNILQLFKNGSELIFLGLQIVIGILTTVYLIYKIRNEHLIRKSHKIRHKRLKHRKIITL